MAKEKKNYDVKTADGRMTVQMKVKGADGKVHSASCDYPYVVHNNGAKRKLSRAQTISMLLGILGYNA